MEKIYKVKWNFTAVVKARNKEEAVEKASEIWSDNGDSSYLVAREVKGKKPISNYAEIAL